MAIHYCRLDEFWTKYQKFNFLIQKKNIGNLDWKPISPDSKQNWLTEGLHLEFDSFIAMGSKEGKADKNKSESIIFKTYGRGVATSRDAWAYNFNQKILEENMQKTIDFYNLQVLKFKREFPLSRSNARALERETRIYRY
jgi:predicted helicase